MNRFSFGLIAIVFIFGGAYLRGYRVITLEEIPNSHRPSEVFLSAGYAQAHLTETNYLDLMK